ncbi:hypothetical protein ACFL3D_02815 [Candidatus Omnitrophota bacterium]
MVSVVTLICLIIFLIISGIAEAQKFIFIRSGYRDAMSYLASRNGEKHLACSNSISEFYFGRNVPNLLRQDEELLIEYMQQDDYKYLVVDYYQFNLREDEVGGIYKYLRDNKNPVIVIKNPMGICREVVVENLHYDYNTKEVYDKLMNDPHTKEIRIYSTDGLLDELKQHVEVE